jgi:hypothetical protein
LTREIERKHKAAIFRGGNMSTSSITKNFIISAQEQAEMFVEAMEASARNRPVHI